MNTDIRWIKAYENDIFPKPMGELHWRDGNKLPITIGAAYTLLKKGDYVEYLDESPLTEVKEQQGVEYNKELLADWRNGKYPDLSHFSAQEKADFISGLVQIAAKEIMMTFYACGLKTHIECEVVNDPTNERFKFSFIKLPNN